MTTNERTPLPFRLGAMYWQNPKYGKAEVEEDMRRIRDNNFSIIRAFIWWEEIERRKGTFEFAMHDVLFDAAAKHGIGIMETFGLYLPLWLRKRLAAEGKEDRTRYACFDRPEVREPMRRYIDAVVTRYKDASALAIWNVWNEPSKPACHCEHTRAKFLAWLQERYTSIEALKEAWLGEHQVFDTLCPDSLDELDAAWIDDAFRFGTRGRVTPLEYDWQEFTVANLTDNVRSLVEDVKRLDTAHECHANPLCPLANGTANGVDHYQLATALDSVSLSVHPSHTFWHVDDLAEYPLSYSFSADKIRSFGNAAGKDAWIGELQAGTTFYHRRKHTPTAGDITHDLWHAVGRGLRGVLFWEWQGWRASMMEVGEFSLRNASDGGPTERSEAAAAVGAIVQSHRDVFEHVARPASDVAIMISMDTCNLKLMQKLKKGSVEGIDNEHNFAAYGCYKALHRANIGVDFVTEDQVDEGALSRYKALYLPHVEVMGAAVASKVAEFVRGGGHAWADGRCAFLDEHVFLRHAIPGHDLVDVFGCREADFVAARDDATMHTVDGKRVRGLRHAQYLEPTTGTAAGTFDNGRVAIVTNRYGDGSAELVGSYLTLGLLRESDEATMDYLASFALARGVAPQVDVTPRAGFEVSALRGEGHDVFVVTNHTGARTEARIVAPAACASVSCPMDGAETTVLQGGRITRTFGVYETAVIFCNKRP